MTIRATVVRCSLAVTLAALSAIATIGCAAESAEPEGSDAEALWWKKHRDAGSTAADGGGATDSGTGTGTGTGTTDAGSGTGTDAGSGTSSGGMWLPKPGTSWQWQISDTGALDTSFNVAMYDIDMFETSAATIASLHAAGRKVVCYFDTAYEPGRPDSATLYPYRGNAMDGWPGQYWLDIRPATVVNVMKSRIAQAQQKGCDAIEADDVDSYSNNPGTGITRADQQNFVKLLAAEAHAKGMSFALKNDLDDIPVLLPFVDFAINEECFKYNECSALSPFIQANKAVFSTEYTSGTLSTLGATVCPKANALNFDTIIKHLALDAARYGCR